MSRPALRAAVAIILLIALTACRPKPAPAPPAPPPAPPAPAPPQSLFVLLPEPAGRPSRVIITNQAGSQELTAPNTAVRVSRVDTPPTPPAPFDPAETQRLFGSALRLLPAEQLSFNLYFDVNTTNLTPASQADLLLVLQAIRDRRSTLISVIGHTDTTGTSRQANYQLGLQRANVIAARLRAIGVAPEMIFLSSHGQDDLLVPTGPNQNEPRNRRVEVTIR
jgi:outer membrane protein OmpA-like peptidoglycan-associated protein